MKISAKDVTMWLASHNLKKTPSDLNPKELEQVAKDLKVDKSQLLTLISSTHWDAGPAQPAIAPNKLNGDLAQGAVIYNHGRGVYDFDK